MFAQKSIAIHALSILFSFIAAAILLLTFIIILIPDNPVLAGYKGCPTFPISTASEAELNTAITCFNAVAVPGSYSINLTADINLTTSTAQINNNMPDTDLVINGAGNRINGQGISGVRPFQLAPDTTVLMTGITITGGSSAQGGGIYNEGDLVLVDGYLINNTADGDGGAIYNSGSGTINIKDSAFVNNMAANSGGAIFGPGALLYIRDSLFQENQAGLNAGAIWAEANMNYIGRSVFISNTAQIGGAMVSETGVSMGGVTMWGNTAEQYGGAMAVRSLLSLMNGTISGNTAGYGGGISVVDNGVLNLNNVTLSGNSALTATGGLSITAGSIAYVLNTIVANSSGADCGGAGIFVDSRYNLIEDGTCISDPTSGSGDPFLAPLAYNNGVPGSLYQLPTHALLPGSPALDAIPNGQNNCGSSTEDQRGVPRPQGSACDIGAFEAAILALGVMVNGNGSVSGPGINCTPDCSENYYESSTITLTASPDWGFIFSGWSGDCGGTAVCTLIMDSPKSVTATFVEVVYQVYLSAVFALN